MNKSNNRAKWGFKNRLLRAIECRIFGVFRQKEQK